MRTFNVAQYKYLILLLIPFLQGCLGTAALLAGATTSVYVAQDRRTAGTIVEDNAIEFKINKSLVADKNLYQNSSVSVLSFNGLVLLTGQANSEQVRNEIDKLANSVAKVRKVYNEVSISPLTSFSEKASDAWVTTKIRGEMLRTSGINPTRVKVTTNDKVVYLLGIVTPEEEKLAVNIAKSTANVTQVVKIFEYLEEAKTPNLAKTEAEDLSLDG